jgi:hypothetical protein
MRGSVNHSGELLSGVQPVNGYVRVHNPINPQPTTKNHAYNYNFARRVRHELTVVDAKNSNLRLDNAETSDATAQTDIPQ